MPVSRRHFAPGQLQFITSSTYRRTRLFESHRFRCDFVAALRELREETGFPLIGWVLMPEHFHLLIKEKLNYMPNNPLKSGLVGSPEEWPWSSSRFYYLNDSTLLSMDRLA
jgi:8-oxo-dGTP pyrophosphatase MutT (NUDIX family)